MQDDIARQIGQQLKACRQTASMTQEELAQATGLSPRGIQKIEAGETAPKYDTLFRICYSLGLNPTIIIDSLWNAWNERQ